MDTQADKLLRSLVEVADSQIPPSMKLPFIGGPQDGNWIEVDPSVDVRGSYRREFLRWYEKYHPVIIHESIKDDDVLKTLILGYRGGKAKVNYSTVRPSGRTIDLE